MRGRGPPAAERACARVGAAEQCARPDGCATPTPTPPPLHPTRQDGVEQHFESLVSIKKYRPNINSTFSCIDSRDVQDDLVRGGTQAWLWRLFV